MLLIFFFFFVCVWSSQARGSTRRVSCGFFRDAASHLCGCLCLCLRLTVCPPPHKHTLLSIICVCVCACVCNLVPGGHFNSVSISSFTWGSWWRSSTRATLPTQHQKLLMSYCCTLLWNIIALWCVNKAGACCHSICSPAGQTGTTSGGRRRWGGRSRKKSKTTGSGWSAGFRVQESWLAFLW